MATKAPEKKTRVTKAQVIAHRTRAVKDLSPTWDGHETWDADKFSRHFRHSMDYYRLEHSGKDLKPKVINWMSQNGYTKDQIKAFKDTKDNRCNLTMGAIAANLLRGMPAVRADFNEGRDTAEWLRNAIAKVIEEAKDDMDIRPTKHHSWGSRLVSGVASAYTSSGWQPRDERLRWRWSWPIGI